MRCGRRAPDCRASPAPRGAAFHLHTSLMQSLAQQARFHMPHEPALARQCTVGIYDALLSSDRAELFHRPIVGRPRRRRPARSPAQGRHSFSRALQRNAPRSRYRTRPWARGAKAATRGPSLRTQAAKDLSLFLDSQSNWGSYRARLCAVYATPLATAWNLYAAARTLSLQREPQMARPHFHHDHDFPQDRQALKLVHAKPVGANSQDRTPETARREINLDNVFEEPSRRPL